MVLSDQGREVDAMRGASRTLAKTRHLYVDYSPDQLAEQGNSVDEFVEVAASQFKSAYVLGEKTALPRAGRISDLPARFAASAGASR